MYKFCIAVALAFTLGGCALFQPPPAPAPHHQIVRKAATAPVKPAVIAPEPAQASPDASVLKPSFRQRVINRLVRQRAVK